MHEQVWKMNYFLKNISLFFFIYNFFKKEKFENNTFFEEGLFFEKRKF